MIREAIQHIQERALADATARTISVPEPTGTYMIQVPGKDPEIRHAEASPRGYSAFSLVALCGQIDHFAEQDSKASILVYVGRGMVTVMLDETGTRRQRLTMTLPWSKPYQFVQALANEPTSDEYRWTQEGILWNLRTEIGADNIGPENLLARLRSLKFSVASDGESEIKSGRESMGKQVTAAVTGGGEDLPDSCTLRVPVYADMVIDEEQRVERIACAIDINVSDATLLLKPLPGEVERAQREIDEAIAEAIRAGITAEGVKVFNGSV